MPARLCASLQNAHNPNHTRHVGTVLIRERFDRRPTRAGGGSCRRGHMRPPYVKPADASRAFRQIERRSRKIVLFVSERTICLIANVQSVCLRTEW